MIDGFKIKDKTLLSKFRPLLFLGQEGEVKYRLYLPERLNSKNNRKLLVWLHGADAQGNDNLSQITNYKKFVKKIIKNKRLKGFIFLAPQCPREGKWVDSRLDVHPESYNTEEIKSTKEMGLLLELINYVLEEYNISQNNLYGIGFSLGAFALWDIIVRKELNFKSIIAVSGGCDYRKAKVASLVKIRAYHSKDDNCVKSVGVIRMYHKMMMINSNMQLTLLNGKDHFIINKVKLNKRLLEDFIN